VNDATVLGAGGELSDFQYIQTLLSELATEDYCADDGVQLTPREIYAYLSRVLYNRRNKCAAPARARRAAQAPAGRRQNGGRRPEALRRAGARFDPLWNSLVVGGLEGGAPFLGTVGMIGVHFTDAHIATGAPRSAAPPAAARPAHGPTRRAPRRRAGFGQQLARPLFRERHRPDMSEEEATELMHDALRVRPGPRERPAAPRPGASTAPIAPDPNPTARAPRCATTATSRRRTSSRSPGSPRKACRSRSRSR